MGPNNRIFGLWGWSPSNRKIFSTHIEISLIKYDFPTPPPPNDRLSQLKRKIEESTPNNDNFDILGGIMKDMKK